MQAFIKKFKLSVFNQQIVKRFSNLGKILNKLSVESGMSQETSHALHIGWWWKFFDHFYFCSVNFNSLRGNVVAQHYPLLYHEVAFFPVQY
ncbi:hypothetical protein ACJW31_03G148000 [Castanea mollissima]